MQYQRRFEHHEQAAVAEYLRRCYPDILFTISIAGVKLNAGKMAQLKRAGYTPGCCDMYILEPREPYSGLLIEMKAREGGVVSPEQKTFIGKANAKGYLAVVCKGSDEAIKVIDQYMGVGA